MNRTKLIVLIGSLAAACGGNQPPPPPPEAEPAPPPPAPVTVETTAAPSAAPSASAAPPPAAPSGLAPVLTYKGAFATPESVLYDAASDRYLVSNINGKPLDVDGNGYIAELSPDGTVKTPKFIAGGTNKAKLDAPKGMGIVGTELWVSDITVVRKFDLKTGAPKGDIIIPGAQFLNDIAVAPDGRAFVADSGINAAFEPLGGDAVYVIEKGGRVKPWAKSKDLGGPNGLAVVDGKLLVNTFGKDELFVLTDKGAREQLTKLPGGGLDGLAPLGGGELLVTSWGASTVYRGKLGGEFKPIIVNVKGPADVGYDSKRNRALLPRFLDDQVEVYEVK